MSQAAVVGPSCAFPRRYRPGAIERWFPVITEPRRERTVAAFMTARGLRFYWPTELVRAKAGRAAQWRSVSMFPSIVFVRSGVTEQTWCGDRVRATPGVLRFMKLGEHYATVDDQAIEALRFHEISGLDLREFPTGKAQRQIPFKPKQTVTFKQGPFGGLYAKITGIDPRGRIRLLLDLFGRATPIDVDADEIAAV